MNRGYKLCGRLESLGFKKDNMFSKGHMEVNFDTLDRLLTVFEGVQKLVVDYRAEAIEPALKEATNAFLLETIAGELEDLIRAPKPKGEYYADESLEGFCVFHTENEKAIASYADEAEAKAHADRLNAEAKAKG